MNSLQTSNSILESSPTPRKQTIQMMDLEFYQQQKQRASELAENAPSPSNILNLKLVPAFRPSTTSSLHSSPLQSPVAQHKLQPSSSKRIFAPRIFKLPPVDSLSSSDNNSARRSL